MRSHLGAVRPAQARQRVIRTGAVALMAVAAAGNALEVAYSGAAERNGAASHARAHRPVRRRFSLRRPQSAARCGGTDGAVRAQRRIPHLEAFVRGGEAPLSPPRTNASR